MKARRPITRRTKESDSTPNLNRKGPTDEDSDRCRKPAFQPPSIPGALQCIHHEWVKYEVERSKWAADRAELEAKVAFLRGQRKGQERLVRDLVCRVKMLEYSLREEREKYHRLKTGTEPDRPPPQPEKTAESSGGEDEDFTPAYDWRQGRQLLRQYLSEIGYTEAVVDVNSYRVNALLRLYDNPRMRGCVPKLDTAPAESDRPQETDGDILAKFAFLPNDDDADDEREEAEDKFAHGRPGCETPVTPEDAHWGEAWPAECSETLGDLSCLDATSVSERSEYMTWRIKYVLRGHYDSVRSLSFHPVEPLLATASEDRTVDLWNLEERPCEDLEPSYTFRGHAGPIMCVAVSPNGRWVCSGGLDGTLLYWELPDSTGKHKDAKSGDATITLGGHTDVVWGLSHQLVGGRTTLLSCSSDGSVRLWAPEESPIQLSSFCSQDGECPTSVDFSRAEPNHMATAYDTGECVLYDLEYGKPLVWLDTPKNHGRINRVVSHPVMPATVTAGEDGCVRFYDDTTGRLVHTTVGHRDSVSSLAIDRYGMYMLTGSHDRTVCVWDVRSKARIQQIHAHGEKYQESVLDVAFHQTRPLVASAGADGCAQVFGPT